MAAELYIKRARRSFDYIFCDPPFAYARKKELLLSIERSLLMSPETLVLIHRPVPENLDPESFSALILRESRRYGASAVDFFTGAKRP
jgi:16S rRNA G966 N2-methylase RsmD